MGEKKDLIIMLNKNNICHPKKQKVIYDYVVDGKGYFLRLYIAYCRHISISNDII